MSYIHLVTTDGISIQHVAYRWPPSSVENFFMHVASLLNNGHDIELWLSDSPKVIQ